MGSIAKIIIQLGVILVVLGIVLLFLEKAHFLNLGHLPGDIRIHRGNFSFYFPIVTCILISLILTIILSLFRR